MKPHIIERQFKACKTRDERRKFVLSVITDEKYKKILEFEKINDSTIRIALDDFLGIKTKQERKYTPKFNDNDHLL